jgi:hypothetical protein
LVFPQIADGGGYVTEFVLLTAAEPSSLILRFYSQDGKPLPLSK